MMLLASAPKRRLAPSHIAAKLTVTRATVSGLINGLERAGLVTREAHPVDGRAEYVHLSRSGLKLLRTMIPALAGRHAYTVAALTRAERETFVAMLRRLRVPAES
jgi:DNA-binding MarR family transcriptional regulator